MTRVREHTPPACHPSSSRIVTLVYEQIVESAGRRTIGKVTVCAKCFLPAGPDALRLFRNAPEDWSDELWNAMLATTAGSRYYCQRVDGVLRPCGPAEHRAKTYPHTTHAEKSLGDDA